MKNLLREVLKKGYRLIVKRPYDRTNFLQSIPKNIKILEIGPFFSPVHRGENVKYFDIQDQQELIERAKKLDPSYPVENIPYIDYVSPTADLTIINEKFDAVFSSHVIEHQFDLIDHLKKTSELLSRGGNYYIIAPDKRFCFDHFQQVSTIADVINAHYEKKKKHSLKSLLEHKAFITHNDSIEHWKGNHGELTDIASKIKNTIAAYEENDFLDVHALYFTPTSFREIIDILYEMEYIDFKVARIHETAVNHIEFCCVLEKMGD